MVVIIRKAMHHILDLTTTELHLLKCLHKAGGFHTKSLMVGGRIREEVKMGRSLLIASLTKAFNALYALFAC